jgi:hypothetical protein
VVRSGLLLFVLAGTDASALMRLFTRFTDEIFAALIAVISIVEALRSVLAAFRGTGKVAIDARALMTLVLALGADEDPDEVRERGTDVHA